MIKYSSPVRNVMMTFMYDCFVIKQPQMITRLTSNSLEDCFWFDVFHGTECPHWTQVSLNNIITKSQALKRQ